MDVYAAMNWLLSFVIFLLLRVVLSQYSSWMSYESKSTDKKAGQHVQCSNNSACPTWFFCDADQEVCHCGNSHDDAIVCNEMKLVSAVLDCHCVTYDEQTESTYLGSCFYGCENYNSTIEIDSVYHKLPNYQNY